MKLTALFSLAFLLHVSARSFSQKITIDLQNVTPDKVFKEIKRQTGFLFLYNSDDLKKIGKVSVYAKNADMSMALDQCFAATRFTYRILDKTIVITPKPAEPVQVAPVAFTPGVTVHGVVTDEEGRAVEGASVTVKGTRQGTVTDRRGEYTLALTDANAELVFSFVGLETRTVAVKGRSLINIALPPDNKKLDETVVIGYGTTTKRKSTGSISSITAEEIGKQPVQNPLAALEGRIAGAVITQANGLPGARVSMLIRGQNSISNGTVPLYVIDGVPFNINDQSVPASNDLNAFGTTAANSGISPFSLINAADIERIDVLKDADATAIYGTRGANGVVLITTRKAKAGKTKIDLNVQQGVGVVSRFLDMMNPQQYYALRREALANEGTAVNPSTAIDLAVWDTTKTTDWQKKYMGGSAQVTDAEMSVSGGDSRTRILLGAGYRRETTIYSTSQSDRRATVRLSADHNSLDRKFNLSLSALYSYDASTLNASDLSYYIYNLPPDLPLYNADGSLYWSGTFTNPEALLRQKYQDKKNNLISNLVLRYTLIPGLEVKASLGFNRVSLDQNKQSPANSLNPALSAINSAIFTSVAQQGYIAEPQVVYNRSLGKGKLTAMAGGTWQQTLNTSNSISATGYSNPALLGTLTGASGYTGSATQTLYKYTSVFGRITYDWQSKYILNGNIRRDGSSRFGADHRFGTFGSIGAAWVFTSEKRVAELLPFMSFGKLRASYGITGNDQLQDYQYIPTLSSSAASNYQGTAVLYPTRVENPDLHWETNKKMEIGLDMGFLKDRILLTANYYRNRSDNQLSYLKLPIQTGFNSYTGNMPALLQNDGFEFELSTKNITSEHFTWTSSLNVTIPRNRLLSIDPNFFYASTYALGKSLNQQWKFVYAGLDATGKPQYRNLGKDTVTATPSYSTDRIVAGDTDPKIYGGLNNTFSYKGFDLGFFVQFMKRDGNIYPGSAPGPLGNGNQNTYWLNRWRQAGDNTLLPKATTNYGVYSYYSSSTAVWGDNSFVKLRNVSLSYSFPVAWVKQAKMSALRVYVQAQNLYTWTKSKYSLDPETSTVINQAPVVMPPLRTIVFGLNCSF